MVRGFTVCGVPGAKPRAVLPNSVQFDAASGEKMATDCRFRSFRSTMLHLRARGFAPVTMNTSQVTESVEMTHFGPEGFLIGGVGVYLDVLDWHLSEPCARVWRPLSPNCVI